MDTQQLQAFMAVAEYQSFSGAAEALHLTQSAVSKRIATLESQLNCRLFDRISRNVTLTEAGSALVPRATSILQSVADTQRAIHNLSGHIGGKLHLATSHHIGLHHLPSVLRRFTTEYPDVELELDFMDSEKAYDAVLHGNVELGIVTLATSLQDNVEPDHKNIQATKVWDDPLCFVTAPDQLQGEPSLKQLSQLPAILPDLNTYTGQLVQEHFKRQKLQLNLSMATNYLETIKMMVSIGLGWSILPTTMVDEQLVSVNIEGLALSRQLGCIQHKDKTLSNAANAFLTICREQGNIQTQKSPR